MNESMNNIIIEDVPFGFGADPPVVPGSLFPDPFDFSSTYLPAYISKFWKQSPDFTGFAKDGFSAKIILTLTLLPLTVIDAYPFPHEIKLPSPKITIGLLTFSALQPITT